MARPSIFCRRTVSLCQIVLGVLLVGSSFHIQAANWGDQGDGTYKNPVIASDYSDPDVIRVGEDYYMVSSTFQYSGGVAILHSKDLVNWETISHAISNVATLNNGYNWNSMSKYKVGIYAPSIRYRPSNSTYYIYVNAYGGGGGFYVCTATDPAGPWTVTQLKDKNNVLLSTSNWTDPCPMFDDETGKAYLATSIPGEGCFLFQLSQDGKQLLDADITAYHMNGTFYWPYANTEGNKIYKWNGYYYLFNVDFGGNGPKGDGGYMKRSTNIYGDGGSPGTPGTYENVNFGRNVPTQGGFVDTPDGKMYYVAQFNGGDYNGRRPNLLPVTWVDNFPWPGITPGVMVQQAAKPVVGKPPLTPQGSDDFNNATLNPRWEWNHEPRVGYWSLMEQPGKLRLKAWPALTAGTFSKVGNVVSQRVVGKEGGEVITLMSLSGMADGQKAGLSAYWLSANYSTFGVNQQSGIRTLSLDLNGTVTNGPVITSQDIWLRIIAGPAGNCSYSYSTNGTDYIPFGGTYTFGWFDYRGTRYALYTWNDSATAGYVDFDFFNFRYPSAIDLPQPVSLTVTPEVGSIGLNWAATPGASAYKIKRAQAGQPFVTLASVSSTSWSDNTAVIGQTYLYAISMVINGVESIDTMPLSAAPVSPSGPPARHWKFDDATGTTAVDSSGNGFPASLINGPLWVSGKFNGSVDLDGSNDYMTLPAGVVKDMTNITLASWVYLDGIANWQRIFDFGTGTTNYMFLTPRFSNTGFVRYAIKVNGSAEQQINGTSPLPTGVWTHVAVTLSGTTGILYVNGTEVGRNTSMSFNPNSLGNTTLNYLGKGQFTDPTFNGKIDDFRIYNKALTPKEITALMSQFQQWKLENGQSLVTPETTAPDGDGIPLLVKYATGLPVGTAAARNPASLVTNATPGTNLSLSFARRSPAPVDYVVEGSPDLSTWSPVGTLLQGSDSWSGSGTFSETGTGGMKQATVTDNVPVTSGSQRFLRLRVNANP